METDYINNHYCNESKLALELDGNFHNAIEAKEYDDLRTVLLNEIGITVLRFWNEEITNDSAKVLQKISEHLH